MRVLNENSIVLYLCDFRLHCVPTIQNGGKLKLHKNGVVFKNNKTGKVEQLNSSDLASVKWMKVAFGYEVKFILNTGTQFKFEGFKESVRM